MTTQQILIFVVNWIIGLLMVEFGTTIFVALILRKFGKNVVQKAMNDSYFAECKEKRSKLTKFQDFLMLAANSAVWEITLIGAWILMYFKVKRYQLNSGS